MFIQVSWYSLNTKALPLPQNAGESSLHAWVWKLRQQIITGLLFLPKVERILLLQQLRPFPLVALSSGLVGQVCGPGAHPVPALPGKGPLLQLILETQHPKQVKGCLVQAQLGPALQGGHHPSPQTTALSGKSKRFLSQAFGPPSFHPYRLPPQSFHFCLQEWGEFSVQRWLQDFLCAPAVRAGIGPRGGDSKMPGGNVDPELPGDQEQSNEPR